MRWRGWLVWAILLLWAAMCGWQEYRLRCQRREIEQIRREIETVQTYLPSILRAEFVAHEERMWAALNKRLPR
jgi:hypothetical protein